MLFKEALRPDGSVFAGALNWNAMRAFSESIMGEHAMHVSSPSRFRLSFTGQLLSGMSTLVACHDNTCGVDLRTSIDHKQLASIYFLCLPPESVSPDARLVALVCFVAPCPFNLSA
jgi:hypothetical protein